MKKFIPLLLAIAIVTLASCGSSGDKYTLKPNLKPGDEYILNYKIDMDQAVMGMNNKITMQMGYDMKMKDKAANGDLSMDLLIKRIAMNMNSSAFNIDYDSDKPEAETSGDSSATNPTNLMKGMFSRIMGGLINKPMQVTLDSNGKVSSVSGYKEIIQDIKDSAKLPEGKDAGLDKMMSEDQIKQVFQQTFGNFPQKPVGIGDKWTTDMSTQQSGLSMKIKNTYTLKEILKKENEAILDITGDISTGGDGTITQGGTTMKMDISGTQTGTMTIDLSTGMIKTGHINQDIKMNMDAMGQKIAMTMKGGTTLEGKKL